MQAGVNSFFPHRCYSQHECSPLSTWGTKLPSSPHKTEPRE